MRKNSTFALTLSLSLLVCTTALAQMRTSSGAGSGVTSPSGKLISSGASERSTQGPRADRPIQANVAPNGTVLPASDLAALSRVYRIGAGDVLNISMSGIKSRESTLFTVAGDGTVDYPLLSAPIPVAGLTPEQVAERIQRNIRVIERPVLSVGVRDYASHFVTVTGLVSKPGTIALQREAVPLYVILSEAAPIPSAQEITLVRRGARNQLLELADQKGLNALVLPGDMIIVSSPRPTATSFYFIGGQVASPGQRDFYQGITLTQAVLASGGSLGQGVSLARVLRRGRDGRLVSNVYDLSQIRRGMVPDPDLQAGDRIELLK